MRATLTDKTMVCGIKYLWTYKQEVSTSWSNPPPQETRSAFEMAHRGQLNSEVAYSLDVEKSLEYFN